MTSIKERIKIYAKSIDASASQIEKCMQMSRGVLGNKNKINAEAVELFLLEYKDVSADWIMTGRGSMLNTDKPFAPQTSDNSSEYWREQYEKCNAENIRLKGIIQGMCISKGIPTDFIEPSSKSITENVV